MRQRMSRFVEKDDTTRLAYEGERERTSEMIASEIGREGWSRVGDSWRNTRGKQFLTMRLLPSSPPRNTTLAAITPRLMQKLLYRARDASLLRSWIKFVAKSYIEIQLL